MSTVALAEISRLDSVTWSGGAIPDFANVANVNVPGNATTIFDNAVAGPIDVESFSGGSRQLDSGVLIVASRIDAGALS